MPKSKPRDAVITVRMPASLKHAVERAAERERRSVADLINFAIESYLGKGGK